MKNWQKDDIKKESTAFVKKRFPNAGAVWFINSFCIVPDINIEDLQFAFKYEYEGSSEYHLSYSDAQNIKSLEVLGKERCYLWTAWKSAKEELEKYEQGRKQSPFMQITSN